jgi:hypothetical protein
VLINPIQNPLLLVTEQLTRDNIKMNLGWDSFIWLRIVVGSYEHDNEPLGSIKCWVANFSSGTINSCMELS